MRRISFGSSVVRIKKVAGSWESRWDGSGAATDGGILGRHGHAARGGARRLSATGVAVAVAAWWLRHARGAGADPARPSAVRIQCDGSAADAALRGGGVPAVAG